MCNLLHSHSSRSSSYPIPLLSFPIQNTTLRFSRLPDSKSSSRNRNSRCFLTEMAVISLATFPAAAVSTSALNANMKRKASVTYIEGLNSYGGLKVQNTVTSLGVSRCADKSFSMVMSSIRSPSKKGEKSRGGAFSSTCNAAAEIFKIAAIMNGLVLVGVAFGFILLRVEAIVEESE
ncbi:uncharacterized protein LOC110105359 isoform X2 [Dendrobium catenatum]|uniref:uncharacterized protein LOC110105359 isoform X2 n=1 Tax=Dendrobium catenatum TaxID=906689 RepID=UPI0009F59785|nr:uncharacterized protein LOC110105359 isoform X2 [Dendrobium catenatum]